MKFNKKLFQTNENITDDQKKVCIKDDKLIIKLENNVLKNLLSFIKTKSENEILDFEDEINNFLYEYINNQYKNKNDKDCLVTESKENDKVIKKIQKWMEKKNSVPYFIIKSYFDSLAYEYKNESLNDKNDYSCKKGKMREIFCSYDKLFTKEIFDRNIKLLCTSSKSAYGNIFTIRRNREDEYNSLVKPSSEVYDYLLALYEKNYITNIIR